VAIQYEIKTEFFKGIRGSGKTYGLALEVLDQMTLGRKVATINMDLVPDNIMRVLLLRGVNYYDAQMTIGKWQKIWTEGAFSRLRDCYVAADEAKFWWPQNQHIKISLETVLDHAMGRKRKVSLGMVDQLDKGINENVRGLAEDTWRARRVFWLDIPLLLWSKFSPEHLRRPAMFYYVREEAGDGRTQARKDGTIDPAHKRVRYLNPFLARCYRTEQEVSSPVLDRMRDGNRQEYLLSLFKGVKAQADCPKCHGSKEFRFCEYPVEVPNGAGAWKIAMHREPFDANTIKLNQFARSGYEDCDSCAGKGYHYPADHPDYQEAIDLIIHLERLKAKAARIAKDAASTATA
jgi:hypothetical protein